MIKDRGVILRSIPYSDSARIIHCFTKDHGLLAFFARINKKRGPGYLQLGSFVEFTAKEKPGSGLYNLTDVRWDPAIPTDPLGGEANLRWLFLLELLQKCLQESLILPELYQRTALYHAFLSQEEIDLDPAIPLVLVSFHLGLSDLNMVFRMADRQCLEGLHLLGVGSDHSAAAGEPQGRSLLNLELERVQQHFGIDKIQSLEMIL